MNDPTWYDCASLKEYIPQEPDKSEKKAKKKKSKFRKALPWIIGIVVFAALIVITSLAFSGSGSNAAIIGGGDIIDALPKNWHDYVDKLYTRTVTDTADVNIPSTTANAADKLEFSPHAGDKLSLKAIYVKCSPSIVGIAAKKNGSMSYSWGTGIIISSDGLIVTNTHVVSKADTAAVTLYDDREFEAKLIGADAVSDIAVLKIDASGLTPAEIGDSSAMQIGDEVAALGNPLGEEYRLTLTNGIISAIDRGVNFNGHEMTLMQTNTAINEGNSGGPLLNMYGQVIGITNMKMMSAFSSIEGIGFAIPSATVKSIVNSILESGEVRGRPSVGIVIGQLDDVCRDEYGLPEGLVVTSVSENSDAYAQGMRVYDIITSVNGIPADSTSTVAEVKSQCKVGDTLHFTVWREGKTLEMDVKLMDANDIN